MALSALYCMTKEQARGQAKRTQCAMNLKQFTIMLAARQAIQLNSKSDDTYSHIARHTHATIRIVNKSFWYEVSWLSWWVFEENKLFWAKKKLFNKTTSRVFCLTLKMSQFSYCNRRTRYAVSEKFGPMYTYVALPNIAPAENSTEGWVLS